MICEIDNAKDISCNAFDDALFEREHHVLYHIFPGRKTELKYDLRQHRHEFIYFDSVNWTMGRSLNFIIFDYFTKTVIDMTRM